MQTPHAPHDAEAQQVASTQLFVPHCAPLEQLPPLILVQVPRCAGPLQELPLAHDAEPQQTPSTTKPEVHWLGSVAVEPLASFAMHAWLALQKPPATQSVSTLQLDLHDVAPQTYGAQLDVPCVHVPEALQVPRFVCVVDAHDCVPQAAPGAVWWHATVSLPLHCSMPQVVSMLNVPHAARPPWGAPVAGLHVPT